MQRLQYPAVFSRSGFNTAQVNVEKTKDHTGADQGYLILRTYLTMKPNQLFSHFEKNLTVAPNLIMRVY
jgi:hypothetical protein